MADETTTTEETEETSEETQSGESQSDDEPIEDDNNQEDETSVEEELRTKQAVQLYELLSGDKTVALTTLKTLAQQMGMDLATPGSQEKGEPTIEQAIINELEDDWPGIGKKLGPILNRYLQGIEDKVEQRFETSTRETKRNSFLNAEKRFFKQNPEARRYFKQMKSLANDYPPPDSRDPEMYYQDLYNLASAGKGSIADSVANNRKGRIRKNVQGTGITGGGNSRSSSSKPEIKTIDDAVKFAAAQLKAEGITPG